MNVFLVVVCMTNKQKNIELMGYTFEIIPVQTISV